MKKTIIGCIAFMVLSCVDPSAETPVLSKDADYNGVWHGEIMLNDSIALPFNFNWQKSDGQYSMTIRNGEERIYSTIVKPENDSLIIEFPVFANYLKVNLLGGKMKGVYINPDAKDYILPFSATFGDSSRFSSDEEVCCDINEKWAVRFSPDTEGEYPAIAYFKQTGKHLTGTFTTETGDYRYLEGNVSGDRMHLSTYDGAHLFYFEAVIEDGQLLNGKFYSGRSWYEPWIAYRDDDFELSNADSLTYLKEGYDGLDFSFPDKDGHNISLNDAQYKGKPVIIQLMGSWCPNCMDESKYLKSVYDQYHDRGLEIISLAFERSTDPEKAFKRINKLKNDLQLPYAILLAGSSNKKEAAKALPMLNHIMSFPTAIYLNKDHKIEKIHTGFSGPGTPVYAEYVTENKLLLDKLVE